MSEQAQPTCFTKVDVTAVPESATRIRHELADWLHGHMLLDSVKSSDVVLAVNEALANAAEFAYLSSPQPGVMHLHAEYDPGAAVLTVTVADQGRWWMSESSSKDPARGRGIPLMYALSDRAIIDSTAAGTRVELQWDLRHAMTAQL
ncbi:ATP-binding protein [Mycobacterium sp. 141]|uniref:ATP-binding protein n=1 Tax=Mycobacterium sp. 141 TaxID=1120797 RepID=UPI00037DD943|nr:ATP-binding protein [Mycobacterium sp. 141]